MLALEERYLDALLPPVTQIDVVDLGCGTGRWLTRLAARKARSLVGVDFSPEMLEFADRKLGGKAKLLLGDCEKLPLPEKSADLMLCSFVGSYVDHFHSFAKEVKRLLRPSGSVFFTDLHPETAARFGWRRSFSFEGEQIDIASHSRPIGEVLSIFDESGLQGCGLWEPCFGEPEFGIFEKAGKSRAFHTASTRPAIFILQLRIRTALQKSAVRKAVANMQEISFVRGARVSFGPQESSHGELSIANGCIGGFGLHNVSQSNHARAKSPDIDLSGFVLLPGLINSHDHLEFALFPRLGKGGYRNFFEWTQDIYQPEKSPVCEQRAVPKNVRLWWGAVRNLLCGVTTVCHHNPYDPEIFEKNFPIRVLRDFGWAHSILLDSEFARKKRETPADQPFVLHLAEGIDEQSSQEIFQLFQQHALDERTVIVHGLGLDERGKALLCEQGASLIWCPTSNIFLFGCTLSGEEVLRFPKVVLGSDSPLTADGDLLDELRFVRERVDVTENQLYSMVTASAAEILRLRNGEGSLRVGALADFIALRDEGHPPAKTLAAACWKNVELVVVGGRIQLASTKVLKRLPERLAKKLQPLRVEDDIRWIRAPLSRLYSSAKEHLVGEIRLGGRKISHVRSN
jgi:cytosine/adenosine deaminase-related metal-dependent hydrolase/SAM-dependent methyltransferase